MKLISINKCGILKFVISLNFNHCDFRHRGARRTRYATCYMHISYPAKTVSVLWFHMLRV